MWTSVQGPLLLPDLGSVVSQPPQRSEPPRQTGNKDVKEQDEPAGPAVTRMSGAVLWGRAAGGSGECPLPAGTDGVIKFRTWTSTPGERPTAPTREHREVRRTRGTEMGAGRPSGQRTEESQVLPAGASGETP